MELFIYLFVCSVKLVLLRRSKSRGNGTMRNKYRSKVREQKVGNGGGGALWLSGSLFLFYGGIKSVYNLPVRSLSPLHSRALFPAPNNLL